MRKGKLGRFQRQEVLQFSFDIILKLVYLVCLLMFAATLE